MNPRQQMKYRHRLAQAERNVIALSSLLCGEWLKGGFDSINISNTAKHLTSQLLDGEKYTMVKE